MPQLLTLPYAVPLSALGVILPGSKLSFFQTGTSTPQPVYTGIDLTVAHSQPVVSNGAGRFPAIYLDPALPDYRILLTDSADVTQPGFPIDDIPANQTGGRTLRLKAPAPELIFEETDASAGNKKWRIRVNGEQLLIDIGNDAEGAWANVAALTRAANTPVSLNFAGQYLRVNDVLVATHETGSFTATLTGMTTTVTGTITWRRSGSKTTFTAVSAITGTSNSTSMTMTGFGAFLPGLNSIGYQPTIVRDNGADTLGTAVLTTSALLFGVGMAGGNFTNSGTKGIPAGWQLIIDSDQSGVA